MFEAIKTWWRKWFGEGTADDWRNPFWRLSEYLAITPEWSRYLVDIRLGFKRNGKWRSLIQFWTPVTQNFWNGIFTFNIYVTKTHIWKNRIPFLFPRFGMVIRLNENHWFQTGAGILFDRGELAVKLVIQCWYNEEKWNPGCNAKGWEEGSV